MTPAGGSIDKRPGFALPHQRLTYLYGDAGAARLFSQRSSISSWLAVERALALAQADVGVVPLEAAEAIERAAVPERVDRRELAHASRYVGYPILPLVEQICASAPVLVGDFIHWGATTQDIMDTALTLQLRRALRRFERHLLGLGDVIAELAVREAGTIMAARTHAQQAVPTTLGAKAAVWLDEVARHVERLAIARERSLVVQLFGAGGTSAALGDRAPEVRAALARRLGIGVPDGPWHTSRDNLAEVVFMLAASGATASKIATEIIELSRSEIGEVAEASGRHRGASSTMPQKRNPIVCEAVVGMAVLLDQSVPSMLRAMRAGHERAAGEWQVEWDTIPSAFTLAGGCVVRVAGILETLDVFPDAMVRNMQLDHGSLMAEAAMMRLAPTTGRLRAHDHVYEACRIARERRLGLGEALRQVLVSSGRADMPIELSFEPQGYLGDAAQYAQASAQRWWQRSGRTPRGGAGPDGEPQS